MPFQHLATSRVGAAESRSGSATVARQTAGETAQVGSGTVAANPVLRALRRAWAGCTALVGITLRREGTALQGEPLRARMSRLLRLAIEPATALLSRLGGVEARRSRRTGPVTRLRRRLAAGALMAAAAAGLLASPAAAQSVWIGGNALTTTDYNTATNWLPLGAPVAAGQSAEFNNTGGGNSTAVNVSAAIAPDAWTFDNNSRSYNITGSQVTFGGSGIVDNAASGITVSIGNIISGSGGVTMNGAGVANGGVLVLTGVNTYSGVTTIQEGTIQANSSAALGDGSASNTLAFTDRGTLVATGNIASPATRDVTLNGNATIDTGTFTVTINGVVSGPGVLIKNGAGTLALNNTNTFAGAFYANGGTVQAASSAALGNGSAANLLNLTNTTLQATGAITSPGARFVNLAGANTINTDTFAVSIAGTTGGSGTLIKAGASTLTLSAQSSYSGDVTISAGTLALAGSGSLLSANSLENDSAFDVSGVTTSTSLKTYRGNGTTALGAKNLTITAGADGIVGGVISGVGGSITMAGGTETFSAANTYTGGTSFTGGVLSVSSDNNLGDTVGGLSFSGGTLNTTATFTSTRGVLIDAGGGTFTQTAATILTLSGIVTGTGTLTQAGAGTLALTGSNTTFSGPVAITGGTLQANASAALGDGSSTNTLGFNNGGILQATGTITSPATRGVTLTGAGTIDTNGNTVSIAGAISGAGPLTKTGNGTLTLTGANTNSGSVTIAGGTLQANASAALGDGSATNTLVISNQALLQATGTIASPATRGVTVTGSTTVNDSGLGFNGGGQLDTNGQTVSLAGTITGGGTLFKLGAGTLALTGVNTNNGAIEVEAGTLQANSSAALGDGTNNNALVLINSTLQATGNIASPAARRLFVLGTGTIDAGTNAVSWGGRVIGDALTKNGTGSLTLSGDNTYSGATTVNAGVLNIQSATGLGTTAAGTTVANGATLQLQGGIAVGNEALTLSGNGSTGSNGALENVSGASSYAGAVTLAAASRINSDAGSLSLTGAINGAAANTGLTFGGAANGTVGGAIGANVGAVTKDGTGTWALSAANGFTGVATVSAGTLEVDDAAGLGSVAAGTVVATGATLFINNVAVGAEPLALNGTGVGGAGALTGAGTASLAGPVTLASDTTIGGASGTLTLSGVVSGAGINLTKVGANTLTLSAANAYTGLTTISAGTLALSGAGSIASSSGVVDDATLDISGVTTPTTDAAFPGQNGTTVAALSGAGGVTLGANRLTIAGGTNTYSGIASGSGGLTIAGGTEVLTGANIYSGVTHVSGGTLQLGDGTTDGALATASSVLIDSGTTFDLRRVASTTFGSVVASADGGAANTKNFNLTGPGTTTLGYSNSNAAGQNFTGTININAGIVSIGGGQTIGDVATNAATRRAVVQVNNGGTLHGTGTLDANVVVNSGGTVSAGNSPGTLTVSGDYSLNSGSNSVFELGTSGIPGGPTNDFIRVGRNLTLGGTLTLQDDNNNDAPLTSGVYTIYRANTDLLNGTVSGSFATINSGVPQSQVRIFTTPSPAGPNVVRQVNILLQNGAQSMQAWDGGDFSGNGVVDGGDGTWNSSNTNWTYLPSAAINDSWQQQMGYFAGNTGGTVAVAGTQNIQGLQFDTTGNGTTYTLVEDAGGGAINATGNPFASSDNDLSFLNVTATQARINVNITGDASTSNGLPAGILKQGGGRLILGGADNNYPGLTFIQAGILEVAGGGAITGSSGLLNGAGLQIDAGAQATFEARNVTNTAAGNIGVFAGGAVTGTVATNAGVIGSSGTWTGDLQSNTGTVVNAVGTWTGAFSNSAGGTIDLVSGTLSGAVNNAGTVNAFGGTIGGTVNNTGTFAVNAAAALAPASFGIAAGTPAFVALADLSNNGTLTVQDRFTNAAGATLTVAAGATLDLSAVAAAPQLVNTSTGTGGNPGVLDAGRVLASLGNSGSVTVSGTGSWSGAATNSGSISNGGAWSGPLGNSGSVTNSGTWTGDATNAAGGTIGSSGLWQGALDNSGSVTNSGTWTGNALNRQGGTISSSAVWQGTLDNSGAVTNAGNWTGNATNRLGGSVLNSGTWAGGLDTSGNVGNTGTWNGAVTNSGTLGNSGTWTSTVTNSGTLVNTGSMGALTNTGAVFLSNGGSFGSVSNAGSFRVPGAPVLSANAPAALAVAGYPGSSAPTNTTGAFSNLGSGVLTLDAGYRLTAAQMTNAGLIDTAGTLAVADTLVLNPDRTPASGGLRNSGTLSATGGAVNGGIVNTGNVFVSGTVTSDNAFVNGGGALLSVTGQGTSYTIAADLINQSNGTVRVGAGATLTDDLYNSGLVVNDGTYVAGTFYNLAGGRLTGSGRYIGTLSNTGTYAPSGAGAVVQGNLTNAGTIDLTTEGSTATALTITGNYVGVAGSALAVNVNLSAAGTAAEAGTANRLTIGGVASGNTTVTFNNLGGVSYYPLIQVVSTANNANGAFTADPASLAKLGQSFVSYAFQNGALVGLINGAQAAGSANAISSILTTLNTDFFQDFQPFITAPQDPDANLVAGGVWVRGKYGVDTFDNTALSSGLANNSRIATEFSGFQVGADVGRFNIDKSGWNVIGGLTAGEVFSNSREKLAGQLRGDFEIPFVGAYGVVSNGGFRVAALYRHDFYGLRLNDSVTGLIGKHITADGDSISLDSGYNIQLGDYGQLGHLFFDPSGSLILSKVTVDALNFPAPFGTLKFNDIDSALGRAGFRFGSSMVTGDYALQPFVTMSVWHEFAKNTTSNLLIGNPIADVPISVTRVGTFGQFGLGLNGEILGKNILGTVRADFRTGDKVDGQSVTAQLRYQF